MRQREMEDIQELKSPSVLTLLCEDVSENAPEEI